MESHSVTERSRFTSVATSVALFAVVYFASRGISSSLAKQETLSSSVTASVAPAHREYATHDTSDRLIAAVLVGSKCSFSNSDATVAVLRGLREGLGATAAKAGLRLEILAVDIDSDPVEGSMLLKRIGTGAFDQAVLGGGWKNELVQRMIWDDGHGEALLPQVVIVKRTSERTSEPFEIRTLREQHVLSLGGSRELTRWSRVGFPIPAVAADRAQQPLN
jgi:hypothetical protein